MITYELCVLLRVMPKLELATTLKRISSSIFDKSGIIRNIENLGTRDMPYKTSNHGVVYNKASYFIMEFNAPPACIDDLKEEYARDIDIIRRRIYKKELDPIPECTLHEELQPPPYRPDVQEMIKNARKYDKPRFNYNTGLDYYPFQK